MPKKSQDIFKVEYKYPDNHHVKHAEGFMSIYNDNGFALITFFDENPEFIEESQLIIHKDGQSEEKIDDKPIKLIRPVLATIKMNANLLKSLSEEINLYLDDLKLEPKETE